jgi:ribosomal protein S14
MAKTNKDKARGFPCVICGGPRSNLSKANKFKICHKCFMEIRYNTSSNNRTMQRDCEICGNVIDRLGSIPACDLCRTKWYRFRTHRKLLDEAIRSNSFSNVGLKIPTIYEVGYEVTIKKKEGPKICV